MGEQINIIDFYMLPALAWVNFKIPQYKMFLVLKNKIKKIVKEKTAVW